MKKDELLGVWDLVSCEGRSRDGETFLPYGPIPIGKLIYTSDGHLAVTLMNGQRAAFASEDISQVTTDETVSAFGSFDAYTGRWQFDETTNRIEHEIEAGRIPNWVGKVHARTCEISDGRLILATDKFLMNGKEWRVYVTWRRSQNGATRGSRG